MGYTPSGAIPLPRFLSSFLGIKRNPSFSAGAFFLLVWFNAIKTFVTANPTLRGEFNRNRLICVHNDTINYTLP